jgi:oxysterol-binding protein-related protein 9/10/11
MQSSVNVASGGGGAADADGWTELIDLSIMKVIPKQVRPLSHQEAKESRRMWDPVTSRLLKKEYSDATREKVLIEQRQRDEAAERKRKGAEFVPAYFERDFEKGWSALTEAGERALEEEMKDPTPAPKVIDGRAY